MGAAKKGERGPKARWDRFWSDLKRFDERLTWQEVTVDLSELQDGSAIRVYRKKRHIKTILATVAFLLLIGLSFLPLDYDNVRLMPQAFFEAIADLFTPNPLRTKTAAGWWAYAWQAFAFGVDGGEPFWMLFEICFLGTLLGSLFSIPIYYLCARNVARSPWIYQPVRILNDFIRSVPLFVVCMFFVMFIGIGNSIAAVLGIAVFSLGVMYQMMYEYIETLEMSPFEAIRSCGAGVTQSVALGLHPDVMPMFAAYFVYTLELNIRGAVILSYVGFSGTYVYALKSNIDNLWYDRAGAMLVPLFIVVALLQFASNAMARKLR